MTPTTPPAAAGARGALRLYFFPDVALQHSRTVIECNVQTPNQPANPSTVNRKLQQSCFHHLIAHRQLLCSWCNYSDKTMWHNCWLLSWYHCCWLKWQDNNFIRDLHFFFSGSHWQCLSIGADISDKAHYARSTSPKTFYQFYLCTALPGEISICSCSSQAVSSQPDQGLVFAQTDWSCSGSSQSWWCLGEEEEREKKAFFCTIPSVFHHWCIADMPAPLLSWRRCPWDGSCEKAWLKMSHVKRIRVDSDTSCF